MDYYYEHLLGTFVFDNKFKLVNKGKKKKDSQPIPQKKISLILENFHDKKYFPEFYQKNIELTKKAIKTAVSEDQLIIQAIANTTELDRVINILVKRLREWYSLHDPELDQKISSHEQYVESILSKQKKEKVSMGADLDQLHLAEINRLAKEIKALFNLRKEHELYLEKLMSGYCPNILELAGVTTGARLIELAKSLKRLALLPSSTVQLLGAEKALFRHIKTGSRSPKYGVIFSHQLIQKTKREFRGKAARMLADKLSLCARLDFFKGEFKAKAYKKELEEKLK
ncbi:MAG: hypothetical protein KKH52_01280 [Nanoarchaeota archaeon]|nr:hypothetical protein [Nanoarchaeota archaeon]MBU1622628.1 hypothetical protein [Nanoarchaeota archaeon]MBU1974009.1 hypothetical protein [Nanoarchaeota archaeon]